MANVPGMMNISGELCTYPMDYVASRVGATYDGAYPSRGPQTYGTGNVEYATRMPQAENLGIIDADHTSNIIDDDDDDAAAYTQLTSNPYDTTQIASLFTTFDPEASSASAVTDTKDVFFHSRAASASGSSNGVAAAINRFSASGSCSTSHHPASPLGDIPTAAAAAAAAAASGAASCVGGGGAAAARARSEVFSSFNNDRQGDLANGVYNGLVNASGSCGYTKQSGNTSASHNPLKFHFNGPDGNTSVPVFGAGCSKSQVNGAGASFRNQQQYPQNMGESHGSMGTAASASFSEGPKTLRTANLNASSASVTVSVKQRVRAQYLPSTSFNSSSGTIPPSPPKRNGSAGIIGTSASPLDIAVSDCIPSPSQYRSAATTGGGGSGGSAAAVAQWSRQQQQRQEQQLERRRGRVNSGTAILHQQQQEQRPHSVAIVSEHSTGGNPAATPIPFCINQYYSPSAAAPVLAATQSHHLGTMAGAGGFYMTDMQPVPCVPQTTAIPSISIGQATVPPPNQHHGYYMTAAHPASGQPATAPLSPPQPPQPQPPFTVFYPAPMPSLVFANGQMAYPAPVPTANYLHYGQPTYMNGAGFVSGLPAIAGMQPAQHMLPTVLSIGGTSSLPHHQQLFQQFEQHNNNGVMPHPHQQPQPQPQPPFTTTTHAVKRGSRGSDASSQQQQHQSKKSAAAAEGSNTAAAAATATGNAASAAERPVVYLKADRSLPIRTFIVVKGKLEGRRFATSKEESELPIGSSVLVDGDRGEDIGIIVGFVSIEQMIKDCVELEYLQEESAYRKAVARRLQQLHSQQDKNDEEDDDEAAATATTSAGQEVGTVERLKSPDTMDISDFGASSRAVDCADNFIEGQLHDWDVGVATTPAGRQHQLESIVYKFRNWPWVIRLSDEEDEQRLQRQREEEAKAFHMAKEIVHRFVEGNLQQKVARLVAATGDATAESSSGVVVVVEREYATAFSADDVKLVDCEYQLNRQKLTLYVSRPSKDIFVDFRRMQRKLYRTFRCRIWMAYMDELSDDADAPVNQIVV